MEVDAAVEEAERAGAATFDELFRAMFPRVARTAALVARDPQLGPDIAQEAFARLYERWDRMESPEHARNFVFRVAVNLAKSHLRRRWAAPFGLTGPEPPVADVTGRSDDWLTVAEALTALSPSQRAAVVLIDYADLDSDAAAADPGGHGFHRPQPRDARPTRAPREARHPRGGRRMTADTRVREQLQRAADPLQVDIEARLQASHRRAHLLQVRRRAAAGAVGLAIVAAGTLALWRSGIDDDATPMVSPEPAGAIVHLMGRDFHPQGTTDLVVSTPGEETPTSIAVRGTGISFSPDGSAVASYVPSGERMEDNMEISDVLVQQLPDGTPKAVARVAVVGSPTWGPEGRLALWRYAKTYSTKYELLIVEPDGTIGAPLVTVHGAGALAWSPDGSTIAIGLGPYGHIRALEAGGPAIVLLASDGSSFELISLPKEDGNLTDLEWSPDGSRLAFARWDDANRSRIWVMNADGTDLRPVTPEDVQVQGPEWSPDGEWIAFSSDLGATEEQRAKNEENHGEGPWLGWGLYAMHPDGSDAQPLVPQAEEGVPIILAWLDSDPTASGDA